MGNVRSLDRYVKKSNGVTQFKKGRLLVPQSNPDNYLQIKLCKNGTYKTVGVHTLVANAFVLKPKGNLKLEVNHKDCNRQNNIYTNLEWCTHYENIKYTLLQGNHVCQRDITGVNNPNYGNHKLSVVYKNNPKLAKEKLSRPGSKNGRAKKVNLYDHEKNYIKTFSYIGECALYLIKNGHIKTSLNSVRNNISLVSKNNKLYLEHYYKIKS